MLLAGPTAIYGFLENGCTRIFAARDLGQSLQKGPRSDRSIFAYLVPQATTIPLFSRKLF